MDDERAIERAVLGLHEASQTLADTLNEHVYVRIKSEGMGSTLGRVYHPRGCDEHREWERDEANAPKQLPAPKVEVPEWVKRMLG